jgi:exopolysaccharide biosynthesis polyprenyl glycosylphosphotransferase
MTEQVLDREAELAVTRATTAYGSKSMSSAQQIVDNALHGSTVRPRQYSRLNRRKTTAVPGALAALVAVILISQAPNLAMLLVACGLVLIGFGLNRPANVAKADTVVLIGRGAMAAIIASTLESRAPSKRQVSILRAIGPAEAASLVRTARCDEVIIAGPVNPIHADMIDSRGLRPAIVSGAEKIEMLLGRVPMEFASQDKWLSRLGRIRTLDSTYTFVKRAIDLVFSLGLGLVLLPLFPVIALAIKLDSRGPILYSQQRIGLGGKPFRIYKFRTMRRDAEANGAVWAQARDPRVTRAGRFMRLTRLDELPQIWNVIRGEMSVVGPRPERPEFTELLARDIPGYDLRHTVKPGLTGWAQVCYRYTSSVRDTRAKVEYDLFYVKHLSVAFDLKILLRTVKVVLGRKGQ